jgi:hypothetical protein
MRTTLPILILVVTSCLVSCYRRPAADGKHSREQFVGSLRGFPYDASPQRQAQVFGSYSKLSVGMSKQQIASILGDPDYSDITGPMTLWGMRPNGSEWVYAIHCEAQFCGTFGGDKLVQVFFNLDDHADWIVPHGINSLQEIGHCCDAPNKSLDASGGGVFRIIIRPAMLE